MAEHRPALAVTFTDGDTENVLGRHRERGGERDGGDILGRVEQHADRQPAMWAGRRNLTTSEERAGVARAPAVDTGFDGLADEFGGVGSRQRDERREPGLLEAEKEYGRRY